MTMNVMEENNMIQDSGKRKEFESGAVRDIADGKGRCDLLPLKQIANILEEDGYKVPELRYISEFIYTKDSKCLHDAIIIFLEDMYSTDFNAIFDLSKHYEEGAAKYDERNWEKGIPVHCFIDSAIRHFLKVLRNDSDEDHKAAFLWNMFGAWWTMDNKPELDDIVTY